MIGAPGPDGLGKAPRRGGTSRLPRLAYVEHCLPGATARDRLAAARRLELALEVANREGIEPRRLRDSGVPIVTVQAYGLHDHHPLAGDPRRTRAAERHVRQTLELAAELGAPRVLTVCGFGPAECEAPDERCLEFFAGLAADARRHGVRILIERLGRQRAGAMTRREELERLIAALDAPDVFSLALDTGHLLDDGIDPGEDLPAWRGPIEEVQLRGPGSRAPDPDAPWGRWLAGLSPPPSVLVVEHKEPLPPARLELLVAGLRDAGVAE